MNKKIIIFFSLIASYVTMSASCKCSCDYQNIHLDREISGTQQKPKPKPIKTQSSPQQAAPAVKEVHQEERLAESLTTTATVAIQEKKTAIEPAVSTSTLATQNIPQSETTAEPEKAELTFREYPWPYNVSNNDFNTEFKMEDETYETCMQNCCKANRISPDFPLPTTTEAGDTFVYMEEFYNNYADKETWYDIDDCHRVCK